MEEKLDMVGEGNLEWKKILRDFYPSFEKTLALAEKNVEKEVTKIIRNVLADMRGIDPTVIVHVINVR